MTTRQRERRRILRYIRRQAMSLNRCGDRQSVKNGECLFLLAKRIERLRP